MTMKSGLWSTFADKCVTSNLYKTNNSHETNLLTLVLTKKHMCHAQVQEAVSLRVYSFGCFVGLVEAVGTGQCNLIILLGL